MIDYGLELAGFKTVFQVESDPFCQEVLKKHWRDVPKFSDVRACGKQNLEPVSILSGGFACTDISIAGNMEGIGTPENPTARSGFCWFQFLRIIKETRPPWVLIENVYQLPHSEDGSKVVSYLEEADYASWAVVLGAKDLGGPCGRRRSWFLCRDLRGISDDPDSHYSDSNDDPGEGVGSGRLLPVAERALEEAHEEFSYWKRQLVARDGGAGGTPELEAETYAGIVRELHGHPDWVDRYRCCGNSVNFQIPALIGSFVAGLERASGA